MLTMGYECFPVWSPGVPYKLKRPPEADQAETHAQTPRRSAALALAGMVRAAIRGAGVPHVMGSFLGVSGYG
jgi:hypothetical protein